jgi:hypothetical protein
MSKKDTAFENKKLLLEMVKAGKPRPVAKSKLGIALTNYTKKGCRDLTFNIAIRRLAPHWFVDTATENKKLLLEMAKKGEPRPKQKESKVGLALCSYTNPKCGSYDPEFDEEIRNLAPHWFVNTAAENKKLLLEMAKRGEPRPKFKVKLGQALVNYTSPRNGCYDPEFRKEIKKVSDWLKS